MPTGLYISVPFCRSKCSYCNFASDVFSRTVFKRYVDRVCHDIEHAGDLAADLGGILDRNADSIYLGGGTPTVLDVAELERLFVTIRQNFAIQDGAEITVECAPGTLTPQVVDALVRCGVNRVSLGVQSYVDKEAAAVGRLHKRSTVINDIAWLRLVGITNINVDLIAGLPHQTVESWQISLDEVIASGVPHVSLYMLEIDDDSRLGRELIAGGSRYHAHFVPDEDLTADLYVMACTWLNRVGLSQYEISNFAKALNESRHNLKYWTRQPYIGFGVDAHSMLRSAHGEFEAVRVATPDSLEDYIAGKPVKETRVFHSAALEEEFFLGLRLTRGVEIEKLAFQYGTAEVAAFFPAIAELIASELMKQEGNVIRLTARGRLLSNEVFQRFLSPVA